MTTSFTDADITAFCLITVFIILLFISTIVEIRKYNQVLDRIEELEEIQYRFNLLESHFDNHLYIVNKNISELFSKIVVCETYMLRNPFKRFKKK